MATHRGKILDVNLSTGDISTTEVEDDVVRRFIGGSGMAAKLFLERVSPDVDPLSAENVLFLLAGPLAGTGLPGSSRFTNTWVTTAATERSIPRCLNSLSSACAIM